MAKRDDDKKKESAKPAAQPAPAGAGEEMDDADGAAPPAAQAAAEEPPRLTLDELRAMGAVLSESPDAGGQVDVVTKGGRKLRLPRDEVAAARLTLPELTGEPLSAPSVESGTLVPRGVQELRDMGCILVERKDEATGQTIVVTKGGQKLRFPGDEVRAAQLLDSELDGEARKSWPRANEKSTLLGKPIKG